MMLIKSRIKVVNVELWKRKTRIEKYTKNSDCTFPRKQKNLTKEEHKK